MNRDAFTAGPWYIGSDGYIRGGPCGLIVADARFHSIAADANARLIVAAPKLVAMLREVLAVDDEAIAELNLLGETLPDQIFDLVARMRAVVNEATVEPDPVHAELELMRREA